MPKVSYFISHFLLFSCIKHTVIPILCYLLLPLAPALLLWGDKYSCSWTVTCFRKPAQQMNKKKALSRPDLLREPVHCAASQALASERWRRYASPQFCSQGIKLLKPKTPLKTNAELRVADVRWLLWILFRKMHPSACNLHRARPGSPLTPRSIELQAKKERAQFSLLTSRHIRSGAFVSPVAAAKSAGKWIQHQQKVNRPKNQSENAWPQEQKSCCFNRDYS